MDSNLVLRLIKEVVKNEVKQQVKEELAKLIKSGAVTLTKKKPTSLVDLTEVAKKQKSLHEVSRKQSIKQEKQYTKNKMINEILNQTSPFSNESLSVLDMVGSDVDDAPSIRMTTDNLQYHAMPSMNNSTIDVEQIEETGNPAVDAVAKALNRDYSALVNHPKFKK